MASTQHLPAHAAGPTVRDAMLLAPRTLPADAPAAEARRAFANPNVHLLLVVRDGRFAGTITPADVPAQIDEDATLGDLARPDAPRVAPEEPVGRAVEVLDAAGGDRLAVVDGEGRLCGLVCWDRDGARFCVDADRVPSG